MDIFASRGSRDSSKCANAIKAQVAAELALDEEATVLVTELACMEEGCPPIETVIAVFHPKMPKLQFRVHRPMSEITTRDIQKLCAQKINPLSENDNGSSC
jgi:hypothetical protein